MISKNPKKGGKNEKKNISKKRVIKCIFEKKALLVGFNKNVTS